MPKGVTYFVLRCNKVIKIEQEITGLWLGDKGWSSQKYLCLSSDSSARALVRELGLEFSNKVLMYQF